MPDHSNLGHPVHVYSTRKFFVSSWGHGIYNFLRAISLWNIAKSVFLFCPNIINFLRDVFGAPFELRSSHEQFPSDEILVQCAWYGSRDSLPYKIIIPVSKAWLIRKRAENLLRQFNLSLKRRNNLASCRAADKRVWFFRVGQNATESITSRLLGKRNEIVFMIGRVSERFGCG